MLGKDFEEVGVNQVVVVKGDKPVRVGLLGETVADDSRAFLVFVYADVV